MDANQAVIGAQILSGSWQGDAPAEPSRFADDWGSSNSWAYLILRSCRKRITLSRGTR